MQNLTSDRKPIWLQNNIRTEFEAKGGTKKIVKEVQAAASKEMAVINNISTLTGLAMIQNAFQQAFAKAQVQLETKIKNQDFVVESEEEICPSSSKSNKVYRQNTKQLNKLPCVCKSS
jgi:uncharacterized protein YchJ